VTHTAQLAITALLSFAMGWGVRSALSKLLNNLAVKILVSHFGQELVLEVLADGTRKMAKKGGAA
jgi:hypothetical protein